MTRNFLNILRADQMMDDILSDPITLKKSGIANELLKEFFRGYPLRKLRILFRHKDARVRKAAIWIASELGDKSEPVVQDAILALKSRDRYIRYFALEVIMLASEKKHRKHFFYIVRSLLDKDSAVRVHAIRFLALATDKQLKGALRHAHLLRRHSIHLTGLHALLEARSVDPAKTKRMLESRDPLQRRYGAAIAKRVHEVFPHLLQLAAKSSDKEIRSFAADMLALK